MSALRVLLASDALSSSPTEIKRVPLPVAARPQSVAT